MELPFKIGDADFTVSFDYKVTNPGCDAQISGPPENCYPAEPMEYEVELISICRDLPPINPPREKWADPAMYDRRSAFRDKRLQPLEIADWLREAIETWLIENDDCREKISEDSVDAKPLPRMRSRRFG